MIFEPINDLTYESLKSVGQLLNRNKKLKKYLGYTLLILIGILSILSARAGVPEKNLRRRRCLVLSPTAPSSNMFLLYKNNPSVCVSVP
jgi:hypothetical protein